MHYVFDFDNTLYNVEVLWQELLNRFEEAGIDRDLAVEIGEKLFTIGYTVRDHAEQLGLSGGDVDEFVSAFEEFTEQEGETLVYKDVSTFIASNKESRFSILTFGDPDYQNFKIEAAGLADQIDDVRIAQPERMKVMHLKELCADIEGEIIFIDDNPRELEAVHEAGLPVTLVRMCRDGARHADDVHPNDGEVWQRVSSLKEITQS